MTTPVNVDLGVVVNSSEFAPPPSPFAYLTGEDLLDYCSVRMKDIDSKIDTAMLGQQAKLRDQDALGAFNQVITKFGDKGPQSPDDWKQVEDAYQALKAAIGDPKDPSLAKVDDLMNTLRAQTHPSTEDVATAQKNYDDAKRDYDDAPNVDPKNITYYEGQLQLAQTELDNAKNPPFHALPDTQWQASATLAVGNILTDLKGGAELDMIQLQSMVSQRQTVVQLVTGMMSKFDQTQEAIAGKIGG